MTSPADVTYRIGHLAGAASGRTEKAAPALSQCYLIQRENGWTIYTPLQFIPVEEIC
jgi:hypothetical protein